MLAQAVESEQLRRRAPIAGLLGQGARPRSSRRAFCGEYVGDKVDMEEGQGGWIEVRTP